MFSFIIGVFLLCPSLALALDLQADWKRDVPADWCCGNDISCEATSGRGVYLSESPVCQMVQRNVLDIFERDWYSTKYRYDWCHEARLDFLEKAGDLNCKAFDERGNYQKRSSCGFSLANLSSVEC